MKAHLLFAIGLLALARPTFSQSTPPSLGPVLTLSDGQCAEVIPADTLRRIGRHAYSTVTGKAYRFEFNGKENDNEVHNATGTSVDFGATMYDSRVGRWLSLDPLAAKYPGTSPYVFAANSPIVTTDPNGGENVVYLVLLNPNSTKLSKKEAGYIAALATARLMSMGLNTRVKVFEGEAPFDPGNLDQTDSYVMFGSKEQILEATSGPNFDGMRAGMDAPDLNALGTNHPEESRKNGAGVFVEEGALEQWANTVDEPKAQLASLVVAHGMGHNAGVRHSSGSLIMWDGGRVSRMLDQGTLYQDESLRWEVGNNPDITKSGDFFGLEKNWDYAKAIKERFGTTEAKDNYSLNEANRQKQ
ncbi:MAG: hypothetical protein IPP26_08725 [Flavobacteriales bacterium]|nr:hypothetical protein [Flavobacteriales bacterium]